MTDSEFSLPSDGTGIAGHAAPVVADTDTKALLHLYNGGSKNIIPVFLKLEFSAIGAAGTISYNVIYTDSASATAGLHPHRGRWQPDPEGSTARGRREEQIGGQHQQNDHHLASEGHPVTHEAGDPLGDVVVIEVLAVLPGLLRLARELHERERARSRAGGGPSQHQPADIGGAAPGRVRREQQQVDEELGLPAVASPETFRGQATAEAASFADAPWWEAFRDPALQALIQEALRNNYVAAIAAARVQEARANVSIARSALVPSLATLSSVLSSTAPRAASAGTSITASTRLARTGARDLRRILGGLGGRGSTGPPLAIQLFVEHDPSSHYLTLGPDSRYADDFRRIAAFDVVINNADRKSGHCLIAEDGVYGVDHGVAFHAQPKLRTVIWEFAGEPIPPGVAGDVASLRRELSGEAASSFEALLSAEEIEALRRRIDAFLAAGVYPHPGGRYPYPWPPV